MFSKECIKCEKMFECAGKENNKPCLHFKERGSGKNDTKQQKEGRKI